MNQRRNASTEFPLTALCHLLAFFGALWSANGASIAPQIRRERSRFFDSAANNPMHLE
jgi:hypothetical protein